MFLQGQHEIRQLEQYRFIGWDVHLGRLAKYEREVEDEFIARVLGRVDAEWKSKKNQGWLTWVQRRRVESEDVAAQ